MSKNKIYTMTLCALFAAVCCICSVITIPTGYVAFSFGLLGIIFTAVVLGPVKGVVSVGVYLLLGLFLPLFSNGQNGISAYFGMSGGYLWSYLIVVFVVGLLSKIEFKNRIVEIIANSVFCAVGVVICYFFGTIQFMLVTGYDLQGSLAACVYPFIPFDALKCVIAGVVGTILKSTIKKSGFIKG